MFQEGTPLGIDVEVCKLALGEEGGAVDATQAELAVVIPAVDVGVANVRECLDELAPLLVGWKNTIVLLWD